MIRSVAFAATLISLLSLPEFASAQFRGRGEDSGRDRGSDSSDRDRSRGSDRGDRGDRGGDDRSRWSGWSGFGRSEGGDRGGDGRPSWGGFSGRGDGESRGGFGPPGGFGGFGGGFGPPGGFGGGFGPPGGFGGGGDSRGGDSRGGFRPSPDFLFDRLDRNQDGRLDGDELKNAWGPMQGMIERAGIREGATKDDFAQGFEKAREEFRPEDGSNGGDRGRSSRSSKYYTPAKKERVTADLPDSYRTRDEDGDGQIGFYEWRAYRGDLDEFLAYDHNGDGFLTPKEIAAGPAELPTDNAAQVAGGAPSASFDPNDPDAAKGLSYFKLVDSDHDGRATPQELGKLNKLRPAFEKAGVRLDEEMSQDQFVSNYLKAVRQ